jgi:hypothetical protein
MHKHDNKLLTIMTSLQAQLPNTSNFMEVILLQRSLSEMDYSCEHMDNSAYPELNKSSANPSLSLTTYFVHRS